MRKLTGGERRRTIRQTLLLWLTLPLFLLGSRLATAEQWSQSYLNRLPDSAFAAIETARDGRKLRRLPHHDHTGALDIPHLRSARGRLKQVKWIDPSNEEEARLHLEQHWREYQEKGSKAHEK